MTRAAIYARYSSDLQREDSIDDQVEVCQRHAAAQGWHVVEVYSDAAISGASAFRPGFQKLKSDAARRRFEVVLCEGIDRLGRRLADTADLQDTLAFHGVRLVTPQLGEVTTMHVAVMGMMAQVQLKDLADKTRRGQLGRVLKGRVAGGIAYGYRVVTDADGGGGREIIPAEAAVVQRIYREYAAGRSPEAIARALNQEGVPGPGGRPWSNTTLRGQADRGTGILNNAIYAGRLEWNRCSYVKDPATGKKVARPNPSERWESVEVESLRIIDTALWDRVKARQTEIRTAAAARPGPRLVRPGANRDLNAAHRRKHLLSGLLICGCCGGGYTVTGKDRYGCATRKQKGTCPNSRTMGRPEIEARVLGGLKDRLLAPELVAMFVAAFQAEAERLRQARQRNAGDRDKRLAAVDRKIAAINQAVEDGFYNPAMKDRMRVLEAERQALLAEADVPGPNLDVLLHPNLPEVYRRKVERLEAVLDQGVEGLEAMEMIRSMIGAVVLTPRAEGKGLDAVLHGDLAQILSICAAAEGAKANRPVLEGTGRFSVVAGAGFEPAAFRL